MANTQSKVPAKTWFNLTIDNDLIEGETYTFQPQGTTLYVNETDTMPTDFTASSIVLNNFFLLVAQSTDTFYCYASEDCVVTVTTA